MHTPREDARVLGYDIAERTIILISTWAIGRDPASWDEPEKFHPERFLDSSLDFKGQDFELIPFGAGRRGCPGAAFAMSSIETIGFWEDSEGEDGKNFLMLLGELLHLVGSVSIGEFIPWLSWINRVNGFDSRVDRVAKEIDEFLEAVIEEHLNAGLKKTEEANKENFVDILLNIYMNNITGLTIDRESIKAIVLDMLAGGTDTTFAALEWAMTELLKNRMIMEKLPDEVKQTLHGKQDITDEDLEKMQYLKAVVRETLRFHTPVPFLAREPQQDVKIMGYDIAAGTMVLINTWAIGRDHATWDEADKFQPERFMNCSLDFKGFDFELIPFGAGRRGCPGTAFSMANIELVLANLMQKFDWKLPNEARGKDLDCVEDPGITIHRKSPLLALPTQRDF